MINARGRSAGWWGVLLVLAAPVFGGVKRYVPPTPGQIEAGLLELINRDREQFGAKPLRHHPVLQEIARGHSANMAAEGRLSHFFPGWPTLDERMQQRNLCFLANGENVAHGQTPIPAFIHEALMASPGHRMSILDRRMLQAGIGVIQAGDDYYITEEFAAVIDCPVPEAAMVRIENELCRWQKERFAEAPVIRSEARLLARVSAQQYLVGNPIALQTPTEEAMTGANVRFNDMEVILAKLKEVIGGKRVASLAVGVAWGRSTGFPGGAYSVCLLFSEKSD